LRGMRKLWEDVQQTFPNNYEDVTTTTVVEQMVKPRTNAAKCRYADLASVVDPAEVGEPMYFISHAWKAPIALLFRVVFEFLANASDDTRCAPCPTITQPLVTPVSAFVGFTPLVEQTLKPMKHTRHAREPDGAGKVFVGTGCGATSWRSTNTREETA